MRRFITIPPVPEPEPVVVPAHAHELLAELDDANQAMIAAEATKLEVIHRLCQAFSCVDDMAFGEAAEKLIRHGSDGTPPVAEYLSLEVAALLGISPSAGAGLIGQVLDCVHRHPMMWEAVRAGEVRWYRATEIIGEVNGANLCRDAALWIDEQITPQLNALTRGRALRLLRGYIALADPEEAREREERARTRRHVTVWGPTVESGPCRDLTGRLDLTDAAALDATLTDLAALLAADGDDSPLDSRRAAALGILADPARAFQLLNGQDAPSQQKATVVVHIDPKSMEGEFEIARIHREMALSRDSWVELLGHTRVTVRPLVDLNALPPVDAYEIPDRLRQAVQMRSPIDLFPYGTVSSRSCDLDHTVPYDHCSSGPPGPDEDRQPRPGQSPSPPSKDSQEVEGHPVRRRLARVDLTRGIPLRHGPVRDSPRSLCWRSLMGGARVTAVGGAHAAFDPRDGVVVVE